MVGWRPRLATDHLNQTVGKSRHQKLVLCDQEQDICSGWDTQAQTRRDAGRLHEPSGRRYMGLGGLCP